MLERRFCPLEDIESSLADFCAETDADEVVLLSFDEHVLLQTLSAVSHRGTSYGAALDRAVRHDPIRRTEPSGVNPLWRQITNGNLQRVIERLCEPDLYEGAATPTFLQLLLDGWMSAPWRIVSPFLPRAQLTANAFVLQRKGRTRSDYARSFSERSVERVNGTANASVHRDRLVTKHVQDALDHISARPGRQRIGDLLPSLVSMARRVTQSAGAAVYFYDQSVLSKGGEGHKSHHGELHCAAVEASDGITLRGEVLRPSRGGGVELAAMVFEVGLPLLLPAARTSVPVPLSTFEHSDGSPPMFELAVPIPSGPGGGAVHNQGVIVLCRDIDECEPYGNYELALLRNVALRVALLRAALITNDAAALIASNARTFAVAEPPGQPFEGADGVLTPRQESARGASGVGTGIPIDLRPLLAAFERVVGLAGRLTGSHSVTCRLLLPGREGKEGYSEPLLVRVAAWPEDRLHDPWRQLSLRIGSINGWVAVNGLPCHIRDFAASDPFQDYAGLEQAVQLEGRLTRSELCTPIIVDQRTIGTLNFESAVPNTFVLQRNIAAACAGQIALIVAAERRRNLRDVLSVGSDVAAAAHELTNVSDTLHGVLGTTEEGLVPADRVRTAAVGIDRIIGTLRFHEHPEQPQRAQLPELVRSAAGTAGIYNFLHFDVSGVGPWDAWTERRLFLAMSEVFRNIDRHAPLDETGFPSVFSREQMVGGRDYISVEISHAAKPGTIPIVDYLYRVPIRASDRLHFGAYVAGAIMRSMGGDMMARWIRGQKLLTLISVPIPG